MFRTYTSLTTPLVLASLLLLGSPLRAADAEGAWSAEEAVQQRLAALEAGNAIQAGPLTVVPVRSNSEIPQGNLVSAATALRTQVQDASRHHPMIRIQNEAKAPVLLLAGRVAGTKADADLVLAHDVVLIPTSTTVARALPASFSKGKLSADAKLQWSPRLAPPSLREAIVKDVRAYNVKSFLALFHDVAGDDTDRIPTLRQVMSSDFARNLDIEVAEVMHHKDLSEEKTIGFAIGIFGRVTALHIFHTPQLMRQNAAAVLSSHGVYAAAMSRRAAELGVTLHRDDEAKKRVAKDVQALLVSMRKVAQIRQVDETFEITTKSAVGNGIFFDRHVAHMAVYPHDPYERALFSRSFEDDADEPGDADASAEAAAAQGALDRQTERGTTTEFEQRLRERRRDARGR